VTRIALQFETSLEAAIRNRKPLFHLHHLSREVLLVMWATGMALLLASLAVGLWQFVRPDRPLRKLHLRVSTWWMITITFGLSLALSPTAAIVFLGFVSFLALKEFLSMTPTRRADRRVLFWAYLAIPIQFYWVGTQWYGMFIIFIPVMLFAWLPTRMILAGETVGYLRAAGTLHWGLMVTVFSLSHAAFLLVLQPSQTPRVVPDYPSLDGTLHPGPGLLLLLVLMTQLNDLFQVGWGKAFGRRRFAPRVSRAKTISGFLGGLLTTILVTVAIGPMLTLLDWQRSLIAGGLVGVAGFAGDLNMAALKRDLGIRDFGATLPGHGGVLDRVDSLTFTAPLFFHFIYYCYG